MSIIISSSRHNILNIYILLQQYYIDGIYMKSLRPINIKQSKTTNPNNSFFSEKKELLGWDSNPRHTAC